jgi:isocitrate dehydrogenase
LYGDILSDVAAQITGSVGLAGSANIGEQCAMFEAIHGSAPRVANQNKANPSGLLQGAVQMLNHIGQGHIAEKVQNAWLKTIEDGIHTYDVYKEGTSKELVGTNEFADAVIKNLGSSPNVLSPVKYDKNAAIKLAVYERPPAKKKVLMGMDVFVHWRGNSADDLSEIIKRLNTEEGELTMITNRGIKVWPDGFNETFCTDHWRCRFKVTEGNIFSTQQILQILTKGFGLGIDIIKTENLYSFDGKNAFSLGQGE